MSVPKSTSCIGAVPVEGNQGVPGSGISGQVLYYRLTCSFISRRVRIEVDSSEGYVSCVSIELLEHHCLLHANHSHN